MKRRENACPCYHIDRQVFAELWHNTEDTGEGWFTFSLLRYNCRINDQTISNSIRKMESRKVIHLQSHQPSEDERYFFQILPPYADRGPYCPFCYTPTQEEEHKRTSSGKYQVLIDGIPAVIEWKN